MKDISPPYSITVWRVNFALNFRYPDIVVYLLYTASFATLEEVKNYKSLLSYRYFTSGWVLQTDWKKYLEEGLILVLGKAKHSYKANLPPLRCWVLIRLNGTVVVAHCTCMAGLAETCSHIGAQSCIGWKLQLGCGMKPRVPQKKISGWSLHQ